MKIRENISSIREVVVITMLPFIAFLLLFGPVWVSTRIGVDSLIVSCRLVESTIRELEVLREISLDLGLPVMWRIPGRPEECIELSP